MSSVGSLCWRLMLISMLAVGIMSCSATRKAIRGPIKVHGDEYLMGKMKEHELKFKNFSAKFSATYETGRKSTSVSGSLRIENDSIIWISVTPALGIEAIRFMLTPDSIKYLNRLNSTYLSQPFTYINQLLNKTLDYDMAQSFLLGNDFSLYESNKFKATIDNDHSNTNHLARPRKLQNNQGNVKRSCSG